MMFGLLGNYDNFPENVHGIAVFQYQDPTMMLQQAILYALYRLNHEIYNVNNLIPYLTQNYKVGFEFGVAEDYDFNFLDKSELERCVRNVIEKEQETLDFFFVVRYHNIRENNKRVPLKFDYHLLRFIFRRSELELKTRHEKGPQHVSIEDLTDFITARINIELLQQQLTPITMGDFVKINIR
jgi:hypothetical protein